MMLLAALLAAAPSVTDACPVPAPWRVAKSDPRDGDEMVLRNMVMIIRTQATFNGSPVNDDALAGYVKKASVGPQPSRLIVNSTLTDCSTLLHVLKVIADTGSCATLDCVVEHRNFPRPTSPYAPVPPPLPPSRR